MKSLLLLFLKGIIRSFEKIILLYEKRSVFLTVYPDLELDLKKNFSLIKDEFVTFFEKNESTPFNILSYRATHKILDKKDVYKWKTVFLRAYGRSVKENEIYFPVTVNLLKKYKNIVSLAFFSCMEPKFTIHTHKGPFKGVLRLHHGLIVPNSKDIYIIVDNKKYFWKENETFIFDDTFDHSAHNLTNEKRVVLFLDVIRPLPFILDKVNRLIINLISITPFVNEIIENNKAFYAQYKKH